MPPFNRNSAPQPTQGDQVVPYEVNTRPVGATLADGDYGDIVASSSGTVLSFDSGVVTAFARTFLDDANAAAVRTTLGLVTIASSGSASDLTSGTVGAARMPALTGDVTTTVGTVATTIGAGAVTLAKMANVATATVFYRKTAGTGAPEVQTLATLKTDLGLTGTNSGDQTITLTGDATGTGTGSFAVTVGRINGVALSGLATGILKNTTTTGVPSIALAADFPTLNQSTTGSAATLTTPRTISITGKATAAGGTFDGSAALALNVTALTIAAADLPAITGGDVTAPAGSAVHTIAADAVTYAKMQNVSATNRFLGRITAGAGDPEELTGTQATTLLDTFTSALKGLVPASGGGTTTFLRADGTWVAPAGGGTVTSVSGTANEISVATGTTTPVLSLPAALTFTGKTVTGGTFSIPTLTTPVINGLPTGTGVAATSTASTLAARDANKNLLANNFLADYTTTATAAGTTTLTVGSTYLQFFTGTTTQTITLPVASTLALGLQFQIVNNSTGAVTVNSSGGNAVIVLAGGTAATVTCILASGTTAASWSASYWADAVASGKKLTVSNSLTLTGTDGSSIAFGTGGTVLYSGGALGTPSSGTLTNCTFATPSATAITLLNLVTNVGGSYATAAYRKYADSRVALEGWLQGGGGTSPINIATLPVGARPLANQTFPCVNFAAGAPFAGMFEVQATGGVFWYSSNTSAAFSISGINFQS